MVLTPALPVFGARQWHKGTRGGCKLELRQPVGWAHQREGCLKGCWAMQAVLDVDCSRARL